MRKKGIDVELAPSVIDEYQMQKERAWMRHNFGWQTENLNTIQRLFAKNFIMTHDNAVMRKLYERTEVHSIHSSNRVKPIN